MPAESILRSSLVVVGPGRAGRALARSWIAAGGAAPTLAALDPESASSRTASAELGAPVRRIDSLREPCDLLVLAVPDDRIRSTAREVSARIRCRSAFHLSGALAAEELSPFRTAGAAVASLHPLRAFTGDPSETWEGTLVAIEGDDEAVSVGERLSAALHAIGRRIRAEAKPLYHAAATLAAGGTMALLSVATRAAAAAGLSETEARRALARLASEAAAATADRPFADVFTGPLSRRDVETVRAHEAASSGREDFRELYRLLASEILDATGGRGSEERIRKILARMGSGGAD